MTPSPPNDKAMPERDIEAEAMTRAWMITGFDTLDNGMRRMIINVPNDYGITLGEYVNPVTLARAVLDEGGK